MEEHFYTLTKPDAPTTDPQGGLYSRLSRHQVRALQSSPSPARLPSLPAAPVPKSLVPCKGRAGGSMGPRLRDGGAVRLPGEPLLEFHRARRRCSSHSALGPAAGQGEGGGWPSAGCGAGRCGGAAGALRPCCRAAGSAGSGAPPTAAAAPRAPPSRCRAPGP